MRRSSIIATITLGAAVAASDAEAKLDLYIDKSAQQISIIQNGALLYVWPVSTGRDKFSTPSGVYTPERLARSWFSKAYYNAPMPHAIFFHNGYAIHGSYDIARLGGPASHGCVRLHPQDAALLFAMVEEEGPGNTTIVIGGGRPLPPRYRDFDGPPRPPYLPEDGSARGVYPSLRPKMQPYYDADRYIDGPERRRVDNGRFNDPPGPPYLRDDGMTRDAYPPPAPKMQPYYNADRYIDGPERRRADNGRLAMRGAYPVHRPPLPRLDAEPLVEPTPGLRGSYRPPRMAAGTAKSNSKCPTCSPNRLSDEPANRHISPSETAKSPPSASPQPASPPSVATSPASPPSAPSVPASPSSAPSPSEQQQPSLGYKVLPRSYWAGASWRWRLKREQDMTGNPSPPPDSP